MSNLTTGLPRREELVIHRARIDHIHLTQFHLLKGEDANYLRDFAILSTHYSDDKAENVYNVTWSDVVRVNCMACTTQI